MTLDLLTVVYAPELELLRTQARSMALRFQEVDRIWVMVNDADSLADRISLGWWEQHSHKVKIVRRSDLDYLPGPGISGWESQQVMKLLGCALGESDWCVVLDSKTWFVRDYEQADFFSEGRARCSIYSTPEVFARGQRYVESILGTPGSSYISPGGVPNFIKPSNARGLINVIELETKRKFSDWFESHCHLDQEGVTEFACHSAYVNGLGYDRFYTGEQTFTVSNLADWQVKDFDQWYQELLRPTTWTASIQERAKPHLTAEQEHAWNNYLRDKGLA